MTLEKVAIITFEVEILHVLVIFTCTASNVGVCSALVCQHSR